MAGVLITGANGHLGRRLINALHGKVPLRAAVRSPRAAAQLDGFPGLEVVQVDYNDVQSMTAAVQGMSAVVHLVGILKEGAGNSYELAHEQTCATLCAALDGRRDEVAVAYVSILGSTVDSANACLRSKGAAEEILLGSFAKATVLQVPMVLGEGDYAARSLAVRARKARSFGFRMDSLEQPIYAGDVTQALQAATVGAYGRVLLGGPEVLSRRALVQRAAAVLGRQTRVISLPVGLGMALAAVLERISANPPVTRAMLGVLDHDDDAPSEAAASALGITLTPLDEMLRRTVSG